MTHRHTSRTVHTKIIDHVTHGKQVECRQQVPTVARGIIVVAVDAKNGQINAIMGIQIIHHTGFYGEPGVRRDPDAHGARSHTVAAHDLHRFVNGSSTGSVFVKQVAAEQDKVAPEAFGQVQDFFKGRKGVHACVVVVVVFIMIHDDDDG